METRIHQVRCDNIQVSRINRMMPFGHTDGRVTLRQSDLRGIVAQFERLETRRSIRLMPAYCPLTVPPPPTERPMANCFLKEIVETLVCQMP